MSNSLNNTEAAQFLRITKELLYAYSTKKTRGKILETISQQGDRFYTEAKLKAWDDYLKQPWSSGSARIRPPQHVKDYLKVESGGQCPRCGNGGPFEDAHIVSWSKTKSNHHHNLLRLCIACHKMYDDGIIPETEIKEIKEQLILRLQKKLLESVNFNFESLRRPPLPDQYFKGRENEMKIVRKSLSKNSLTIIHGIGGIGKTQLAIQALKDIDRTVLWFNVEQYQDLQSLQMSIMVEYGARSLDDLVLQLGVESEILVFDGYESLLYKNKDKAIQFILSLLGYSSRATFLVTSQVKFADSRFKIGVLPLQSLNEENSLTNLNDFTNHKYDKDTVISELCFFSEGHPLTLRIIGGLINYFDNVHQVKKLIVDKGVKSLWNPERETQSKETSLELCLSLAFEQFDKKQKWLLYYIACFPAGIQEPNLEFLLNSNQESSRILKSNRDLIYSLGKLKQFSFVSTEKDIMEVSRLTILNPIKIYLKESAKSQIKLIHSIQIEAFQWLVFDSFMIYQNYMLSDNIYFGIFRYELELPNLLFAVKRSVHVAYCKKCQKHSDRKEYLFLIKAFASSLYKFLFTRGYYKYGIYINKQGAKAHMELGEYDEAIEDLVQVASIYLRNYQNDKAHEILDMIHECIENSGGKNKYPPAFVLEGELIRDKEPQRAIKIYQEGIKIAKKNLENELESESNLGNLATLYSEVGRIYERYSRPNQPLKALENYKTGYETQKQMKDYANMYCNSHHIGNCYADLGKTKMALKYYKEALLGFIETRQDQYIGNSMSELGRLMCLNPALDLGQVDSKEILNEGLHGIKSEIYYTLEHNRNPESHISGGLYREQLTKLFNIIKLVSFTHYSNILKPWSSEIIGSFDGENTLMPNYPWLFLHIAQLISYIEANPMDEESIIKLKKFCYLFGNEFEHDIYDPFEWLAQWLKFTGIDITASREHLFAEAEFWVEEYFNDEIE